MKRIYAEDINGEAAILFVDDNGKAVYVSDTAFDEPLTYEVAVRGDYSNFLDFRRRGQCQLLRWFSFNRLPRGGLGGHPGILMEGIYESRNQAGKSQEII